MRTIVLGALAATALVPVAAPTAAAAQSYGEVRRDQREDRQDQRDVNRDRRNLRAAQAYGTPGDVRDARHDLRDSRQELREDRRETREDWRDYRNSHRDWYRRGAYAGPRGYRYRPVSVGYRFAPEYYGRNYWVNDWQRYRLAAPLGYQRYVRYGNDVVLVDIRSGRVANVYGGFFY